MAVIFFFFLARQFGFNILESKYAAGWAAESAAFSLLEIGSIISHLLRDPHWDSTDGLPFWDHFDSRFLSVFQGFSSSCSSSFQCLCLSLRLVISSFLDLTISDWSLFWVGTYANLIFIFVIKRLALHFHIWRNADPFSVHTPTSPMLSTSTPFVQFIFHACFFIHTHTHTLFPFPFPSLHIAPTSSSPRCPPLAVSTNIPLPALALGAPISGRHKWRSLGLQRAGVSEVTHTHSGCKQPWLWQTSL